MVPTKAKPVDRAVPVMRKPKHNDATKVSSARAMVTAMQGSSLWNANPALQASANAWKAAADTLDGNATVIDDLRGKLAAALSAQRANRRNWTDAMRHVTANVAIVTQGSSDQVHDLGFDVRTHAAPGRSVSVPTGLSVVQSDTAGEVIVKWTRGDARHGFVVQHATDVANPATVSAPIPCTKTSFKLQGLTAGTVVHVRVAAIDSTDPSGHTAFTDWAIATPR